MTGIQAQYPLHFEASGEWNHQQDWGSSETTRIRHTEEELQGTCSRSWRRNSDKILENSWGFSGVIYSWSSQMRLENVKAGRKGNLNIATEVFIRELRNVYLIFSGLDCLPVDFQVFQVAPSIHMVEVRKAKGDTLEFHKVRIITYFVGFMGPLVCS